MATRLIALDTDDALDVFSSGSADALSISNEGAGRALVLTQRASAASLQIVQKGNASASVSVGGAINLDNSLSTGAGVVVYSTQASPSGRLVVINANAATFNQAALHVQHAGTGNAINVVQSNTSPSTSAVNITSAGGNGASTAHTVSISLTNSGNTNAAALNVVSSNTANSAMWLTGSELSRGTLKIAHVGDAGGADSNASAISIDLQTAGTASQGIFMDATQGATTGNLLEIRNNAANRLRLSAAGQLIQVVPNSAWATTNMWNGSMAVWVNEATNALTFQVKYSTGTVKTGTVALA